LLDFHSRSLDREDDHGEESEGKEEIDEGEKEGGSGAQEEKSSKICRAKTGEAFGEKGRSEAQSSGQKTGARKAGPCHAGTRAGSSPGPIMGAAGELRFWGHRQLVKRVPFRPRSAINVTARARARAVTLERERPPSRAGNAALPCASRN
jgi:hypothetical protein